MDLEQKLESILYTAEIQTNSLNISNLLYKIMSEVALTLEKDTTENNVIAFTQQEKNNSLVEEQIKNHFLDAKTIEKRKEQLLIENQEIQNSLFLDYLNKNEINTDIKQETDHIHENLLNQLEEEDRLFPDIHLIGELLLSHVNYLENMELTEWVEDGNNQIDHVAPEQIPINDDNNIEKNNIENLELGEFIDVDNQISDYLMFTEDTPNEITETENTTYFPAFHETKNDLNPIQIEEALDLPNKNIILNNLDKLIIPLIESLKPARVEAIQETLSKIDEMISKSEAQDGMILKDESGLIEKQIQDLYIQIFNKMGIEDYDTFIKNLFLQNNFSNDINYIEIHNQTSQELTIDELNFRGTHEYKSLQYSLSNLTQLIKQKLQSHTQLGKYVLGIITNKELNSFYCPY